MGPRRQAAEGLAEGFCREVRGGFTIYRPRTALAAELVGELLPDPDRILEQGEIFKPGSRTHAGKVVLGERPYFLKRFNCRGWWYVLRHLLKQPRATRTWEIHCEMFRRGLPVPEPFVCIIEKKIGFLRRSYILSEFADGFRPLYRAWSAMREEEKKRALVLIGDLLGKIHREGILHRDCKWSNILIREAGDRIDVVFIDLDGSRIYRRLSPQQARKDIDRFLRDLRKADGNETEAGIFLESWTRRVQWQADAPKKEAGSPALFS